MRLTPVWVSDATTLRLEFQGGAAKPLVTFAVQRDVGSSVTASGINSKVMFSQIATAVICEFQAVLTEDGAADAYKKAMIDSMGK